MLFTNHRWRVSTECWTGNGRNRLTKIDALDVKCADVYTLIINVQLRQKCDLFWCRFVIHCIPKERFIYVVNQGILLQRYIIFSNKYNDTAVRINFFPDFVIVSPTRKILTYKPQRERNILTTSRKVMGDAILFISQRVTQIKNNNIWLSGSYSLSWKKWRSQEQWELIVFCHFVYNH